jgi:hypothetical protein
MLFVDHRHLCQESLLGASHQSIDCVWVFDGSLGKRKTVKSTAAEGRRRRRREGRRREN